MSFILDPKKQGKEMIFSRKTSKRNQPNLMLKSNIVNLTIIHKYLGMILYSKLNFDKHFKSVLKKKKIKLLVYFETSRVSSLELA